MRRVSVAVRPERVVGQADAAVVEKNGCHRTREESMCEPRLGILVQGRMRNLGFPIPSGPSYAGGSTNSGHGALRCVSARGSVFRGRRGRPVPLLQTGHAVPAHGNFAESRRPACQDRRFNDSRRRGFLGGRLRLRACRRPGATIRAPESGTRTAVEEWIGQRGLRYRRGRIQSRKTSGRVFPSGSSRRCPHSPEGRGREMGLCVSTPEAPRGSVPARGWIDLTCDAFCGRPRSDESLLAHRISA